MLMEIPRGAHLMVRIEGETEKRSATFHRIDGSYSLCTLDGDEPFHERAFHLYHAEEMVQVGEHYELAGDSGRQGGAA